MDLTDVDRASQTDRGKHLSNQYKRHRDRRLKGKLQVFIKIVSPNLLGLQHMIILFHSKNCHSCT